MEGLAAYSSDSDATAAGAQDGKRTAAEAAGAASASEDSYFGSDSSSEDSATVRRRAAEARLRDYGEEATSSGAAAGPTNAVELLPSAGAALGLVAGRPAFLDPEATRPVARAIHRGRPPGQLEAEVAAREATAAEPKPGDKRPAGWDIASMAPKQKGEVKQQPGQITAAAKRNRPLDDDSGIVTAAQVALMGGQWRPSADSGQDEADAAPSAAPGAARPGAAAARKKTAALPVSEFLDRGVGGAALPRSRQDRKDKEKEKRGRGQSSVSHWKSEAEMVLRQQYDS